MIRADLKGVSLSNFAVIDGTVHEPAAGVTRVYLATWPPKPVGSAGWTFAQTGTHAGAPLGVATAEPISLLAYKKARVIALETERASVLAAAASTGWDYSAELTTIDAEIEGLKA
jgi:hypothetical protein